MAGLLDGKVALITGAAAGIGAGIAELFATQGARLYLMDVDGPGVEACGAAIRQSGGVARAFEADVRSSEAVAPVVEGALGDFGRIDVLVNNAGVYPRRPFLEMTRSEWDGMLDVNLNGVYNLMGDAVPFHSRSFMRHVHVRYFYPTRHRLFESTDQRNAMK
jgi:NAD(P)-dependent dehydrogenase (short-subunit alcohol dehydrogenase family)